MVTVEDGVFGAVADVAQIAAAFAHLPQGDGPVREPPAAPSAPQPEEAYLGDWSI